MTDSIFFNASGFELLFLASAFVGVWFAGLNLVESVKDLRAIGGITNGRRAIAVSNTVTETLRLSIHALYIIAGVVASFTPSSGNATGLTVLILSILVYASWAVTAISYISRRTRLYLLSNGLQARDEHGRFVRS
jgi:ABC-type polysaccharide/polyol phosphate export permease